MNLTDFDFKLPAELIAQTPARPRNRARLLVYNRATGQIIDDYFYNLQKYLAPKTTLVLNDSKVEKCRFRFGGIEIFVVEAINPTTVWALVRPGKKFQPGKTLKIALKNAELRVKAISVDDVGIRTLALNLPIDSSELEPYKQTPFPPYIKANEKLASQYQTVYAKPLGSKAAPTAGLHFTKTQLTDLAKNHPVARLTLHVGLGTFAPVKGSVAKHKMHSEEYFLSAATAKTLNRAKHVTAVGTTSLRTLESLNRPYREASGQTDIFIKPGYKFKNTDSLITNFHLPKSTLLMLVAAFMGSVDQMQNVYAHAIGKKYRFYSFGDAMLII